MLSMRHGAEQSVVASCRGFPMPEAGKPGPCGEVGAFFNTMRLTTKVIAALEEEESECSSHAVATIHGLIDSIKKFIDTDTVTSVDVDGRSVDVSLLRQSGTSSAAEQRAFEVAR